MVDPRKGGAPYTPDPVPPSRLPFDAQYWMPGMRLPRLLPARLTLNTTLVGVNGSVLLGEAEGARVYVVAVQHRARKSKRINIVCVHPNLPHALFHLRRSHYTIG